MARCNICGGAEFRDFNGRALAQCANCYALERHRVCLAVYREYGLLDGAKPRTTVLHLAPEKVLANFFIANQSLIYLPSDPQAERYPGMKVLRLFLPEDLKIFPDEYFNYIVNNHVLEHIPGHWKDHLCQFKRLLAPGGAMIFSVPGPTMSILTEEGGEALRSDSERLLKFGQEDHVRRFGGDLPQYLASDSSMQFMFDTLSDAERAEINVKPGSNRVMIWSKLDQGKGIASSL